MLLRGEHGINVGELAAPASSILYPYLLAVGLAVGLGDFAPLAFNVVALIALLALLYGFLRSLWPDLAPAGAATATVLLVLMVNGVGLVLTGMEHTLHLLATAGVAIGLARRKPALPWFFHAGIVAGPLIRFEGLAVSMAGALVAYWCWRDRRAVVALAVALALVGLHMAVMVSLGLPPLPSSVLTKSGLTENLVEGSRFTALLLNMAGGAITALTREVTPALLICLALAIWHGWRGPRSVIGLAAFAVMVFGAHMVAGRFGWFYRYEPYMVLAVLLAALPALPALAWPKFRVGTAVAVTAILLAAYAKPLWLTPTAANNIYEQQYQMHRFITEVHDGPVAVNDLGWTSYRNDGYVLDIYGLGHDAARKAKRRGLTAEWLDEFVGSHDTALAILYEGDWAAFPIPAHWVRLAELRLSRERITPAEDTVAFYAADPAAAERIAAELCHFAPTLPPGPTLELARPCP